MNRIVVMSLAVGISFLAGCAARQKAAPAPPPAGTSGFLDDYSSLRPGGPDDAQLVYRNPDADWRAYDKVLFEPVTLWRSGKDSLAPISEDDLIRLASSFEAAVRRRLGASFTLVEAPAPGVLLVRLAITEARASDPVLDVLTASEDADASGTAADGPLSPELEKFVDAAAIEGELRDAQTKTLLAQGVDRRRSGAPRIATWAELDALFARWADQVCGGLEARTGRGS